MLFKKRALAIFVLTGVLSGCGSESTSSVESVTPDSNGSGGGADGAELASQIQNKTGRWAEHSTEHSDSVLTMSISKSGVVVVSLGYRGIDEDSIYAELYTSTFYIDDLDVSEGFSIPITLRNYDLSSSFPTAIVANALTGTLDFKIDLKEGYSSPYQDSENPQVKLHLINKLGGEEISRDLSGYEGTFLFQNSIYTDSPQSIDILKYDFGNGFKTYGNGKFELWDIDQNCVLSATAEETDFHSHPVSGVSFPYSFDFKVDEENSTCDIIDNQAGIITFEVDTSEPYPGEELRISVQVPLKNTLILFSDNRDMTDEEKSEFSE